MKLRLLQVHHSSFIGQFIPPSCTTSRLNNWITMIVSKRNFTNHYHYHNRIYYKHSKPNLQTQPSLRTIHTQHENNNNSINTTQSQEISNRQQFKSIPIHKSILSHIQTLGVGLPLRHFKKQKRKNHPNQSQYKKNKKNDMLSIQDEQDYFANRLNHARSLRKTAAATSTTNTKLNNNNPKQNSNIPNTTNTTNNWWEPPPPFASSMTTRKVIKHDNSTHDSNSQDRSTTTSNNNNQNYYTIQRLPVKIIGSIDSLQLVNHPDSTTTTDTMPPSLKYLPEIAIAGRSNVGKSTLLNALLYGNIYTHGSNDDDILSNTQPKQPPSDYKRVRGKTPDGMKLPKGIKASVSDKPGETKSITFYQLSSKLIPNTNDSTITSPPSTQKQHQPQHPHNTTQQDISIDTLSLLLIDLPGYGFAYASESKLKEWKELMTYFITNRGNSLKRILLLIDARHGFKKADYEFLNTLQDALKIASPNHNVQNDTSSSTSMSHDNKRRFQQQLPPIQLILTKCDLVTQEDLARRVVQVKEQLSNALIRETSKLPIMLVSAKAGLGYNNIKGQRACGGILELQRELAALVQYPK